MSTKLPTFSDFNLPPETQKALDEYFKTFDNGRNITGLAIVACPDAALRAELLYATVEPWEQKVMGGSFDGGGVSTLEQKTHYHLPDRSRMQQLEYQPGETVDKLKTLMRAAPDFIVLDLVVDNEAAEYLTKIYLTGARVIAGVDASDMESAKAKFPVIPGSSYGLDLLIVATDRNNIRVSVF